MAPLVSVQAHPTDAASWAVLARRVEDAGFDALLVGDHPGSTAAPFVALAAAAGVTERIGLGTYVAHAGLREPLLLASDTATLDVVSGGRARLALGAGHTPVEWAMLGGARPEVDGRIRRLLAVAEATRALLAGEEVTVDTPELTAHGARLEAPRPVQQPVPFALGGGNSALLRWAGAHADVVALSGLGRTLSDGHRHEVRWAPAQLDRQLDLVADAEAGRSTPPAREALVQHVELTDDAEGAAQRFGQEVGCPAEDVLACPYVWVGTASEIAAELGAHADRWGLTRYVVREAHLDAARGVLDHLTSGGAAAGTA